MNPKVSVIVPVYNVEKYLKKKHFIYIKSNIRRH